MGGISFCCCNNPRPDEYDCCYSCGDDFASNRLENLHLCNCEEPSPDFSKGTSEIPCLRCGKDNADVRKKEIKYLKKITRWPNGPFRIMGSKVIIPVWLLFVVFCLPIIHLMDLIDKLCLWWERAIERII